MLITGISVHVDDTRTSRSVLRLVRLRSEATVQIFLPLILDDKVVLGALDSAAVHGQGSSGVHGVLAPWRTNDKAKQEIVLHIDYNIIIIKK